MNGAMERILGCYIVLSRVECIVWQKRCIFCEDCTICVYGIQKRMVLFQKFIKNLFITLHGHNIYYQQRKLPKFFRRYQQFASHAYCGATGPSFQDGVAAGESFLCAPF
jgi:hypothetical protein